MNNGKVEWRKIVPCPNPNCPTNNPKYKSKGKKAGAWYSSVRGYANTSSGFRVFCAHCGHMEVSNR